MLINRDGDAWNTHRHTIHKLPSGDKLMAMTDVRVRPSKKGESMPMKDKSYIFDVPNLKLRSH